MGTKSPSAKGADFERQICQRLSLWVSCMTRQDVYWRSAMSGGRASLKHRKEKVGAFAAQVGDLSCIHQCGHLFLNLFMVECKFFKSLLVQHLVFGHEGYLDPIWEANLNLARSVAREPFIVAKENRQPELVLTTPKGIQLLQDGSEKPLPLRGIFPLHGMSIMHLRDVLTKVDFNEIRKAQGCELMVTRKRLKIA